MDISTVRFIIGIGIGVIVGSCINWLLNRTWLRDRNDE